MFPKIEVLPKESDNNGEFKKGRETMSQQIEIEFKNLLTGEEFKRIMNYFNIEEGQMKKQVNHYFDTDQFHLKQAGSALRIREKADKYELTLKQPAEIGLLETHQMLSKKEADNMLQHGLLPNGPISSCLAGTVPVDKLEYFGSLTTYRAEIDYQGGVLVFDKSVYLDVEDFEIEYEVTDAARGKQIFYDLLKSLQIPIRETANKVKRFYRQKQRHFE
jgi:uncharacterized protein YjbK